MQGLDITINGDGSDKLDFTYINDLVQDLQDHPRALPECPVLAYADDIALGLVDWSL